MRVAFLGTPEFAVPALDAIAKAGHEIVCVYSQPPRPAGRGHKLVASPIQHWAEANGIEVRTPVSLKDEAVRDAFRNLKLDVAVVAAYGLILPRAILDAPTYGCLNIHASLLPRWRGAAPIERAILAGDAQTGVTIMQMEVGLDTGPMLLTERVAIGPRTTATALTNELSALGAKAIVQALADIKHLTPQTQPADGVTYAAKLTREEGRIDWTRNVVDLDRQVRALNPRPGVWFEAGGERVKLLRAAIMPGPAGAPPGTLLDDDLTVACGDGALRLTELQRAGKAAQPATEFRRGFTLPPVLS
ncbi:methionyl-tRNA formyltransferase [Roseiterribacter gracilis]|uniref:Methionyl-tRNA formyltransferase n=1 Tax=Roseiterribacter gracilis TaxID=2812848 RepID=A0A8S8XFM1_9PROT|nr:methionyl-tRNA formyltransferase [Rhodospirillales bacterium TMPK1]